MIKILLIEDDQIDQMAFERMVKKQQLNYDYTISGSIQKAKDILIEHTFDIVITDYNLGDGTAFEIFDLLEDTLFILATGAGDEEIAVKALRAGAYDYLVKDKDRNYLKVLPLTIEQAYKRKQKDERLRLLEAVVVNANDAVLITTAHDINDLKVVYANAAFSAISGYDINEMDGHSPKQMQGEHTDRETLDKIRKALEHSQPVHVELINYTKTGIPYWVDLNIVPLFNEKGKVTHFVSIQRDITERKKAEKELIQAKQTAEHAQAAEKQFLANMSHEIRTPMNAVIGMTHLLLDSNPSEKQLDYLHSLKFSADSLLGIINDILDVSKIESGKMQFEEIEFDLIDLLHSVQKAFRFKIREKKTVLVTSFFDLHFEHYLLGDSTRLTQILINLLGNAGKFTEKGEINLSAKLLRKEQNVQWVEFKVSDTGIGIAPEKMKWVFDKFKQADSSINRQFGGTGLGLAIVKQLVELQGGTIHVESEVNLGTTFTLHLPFKNSGKKIVHDLDTIQPEDYSNEDKIPESLRLLVVEDNLMNQKLIKIILDQWGVDYTMANNGKIAVEKTLENQFDLILMDIQMPVMDGYEATVSIKGNLSNPNHTTPIVALSAAALVEEKKKALHVGMLDFLTKPYTPIKLKNMILKTIRNTTAHPEMKEVKTIEEKRKAVDIDFTYLQETFGGDNSFVREMVDLYLEQNPIDLEKLAKHIQEEDWEKTYKIAHKIKSGYLMMGMRPQELMAAEIEKLAYENPNTGATILPIFQQLKSNSEASYPLLNEALEELN